MFMNKGNHFQFSSITENIWLFTHSQSQTYKANCLLKKKKKNPKKSYQKSSMGWTSLSLISLNFWPTSSKPGSIVSRELLMMLTSNSSLPALSYLPDTTIMPPSCVKTINWMKELIQTRNSLKFWWDSFKKF